MEKLKVGLVGSSQLSFPGDKTGRFARSADEMREFAECFGFDLYVYPETIIAEPDAERAVKAVEGEAVDFLLLQTTSYSAGHLIPHFARAKVMALGLWAIPEGTKDGVMPLNSFCSVNMYSGIIGHYVAPFDLPFKWFFGDKGSPFLDERLRVSIAALTCIKRLKASKLALVGGVAPGFNDLLYDESKLLKMFEGMKLNRLHEFGELRDRAMSFTDGEIGATVESMVSRARCIHPKAAAKIGINARFYKAFGEFAEENGYDALAISCWPAFGDQFDFSPCALLGQLNEEGVAAACEGDLVSAVCMLMLRYLAEDVTTLMDLVNFDETDETILLWHCGPTAKQFCAGFDLDLNYSGRPHEKGMIDPNGNGVVRQMVFKPGKATVARLDAGLEKMLLMTGDFIDRDKPSHKGSRGWLENVHLSGEKISVRDLVNTVLTSRFPHHYPVVMGDFTKEIAEICAWMGLGQIEKIPYRDFMQNRP